MDFFTYEVIAVLVISWLILYPILFYIPWYQWWNKYDPQRQYGCFSPVAISFYLNNPILYWIYNYLLTIGPKQFKEDFWIIFISGIMSGEAIGITENGLCTPKTLCDSLIPDKPPSGILPPPYDRGWPTDKPGWQTVIMYWLGFSKAPTTPSEWTPDANKWMDPDNFLNNWGITTTSPALVGFITNWGSYQNQTIWPGTLDPLLGLYSKNGAIFGGWFGYLQAGGAFGEFGLVEAQRNIWSSNPAPQSKRSIDGQTQNNKCSSAAIVSGALGTGMGGAFAGAAISGPFAPLGALIGFLIGAAVGGTVGAWGGNCFKGK